MRRRCAPRRAESAARWSTRRAIPRASRIDSPVGAGFARAMLRGIATADCATRAPRFANWRLDTMARRPLSLES